MVDAAKMGGFIRQRRTDLNLTQKELAEKVGVSDKTVSKWERGVGFPDISILEDLTDALEIDLNQLIRCKTDACGTENSPKSDNREAESADIKHADSSGMDSAAAVEYETGDSKQTDVPINESNLQNGAIADGKKILAGKVKLAVIIIAVALAVIAAAAIIYSAAFRSGTSVTISNNFTVEIKELAGTNQESYYDYGVFDLSCIIEDVDGNSVYIGLLINDAVQITDIEDYRLAPGYTMYIYPTENENGFEAADGTKIDVDISFDSAAAKTIGLTGGDSATGTQKELSASLRIGTEGYFMIYIKNESSKTISVTGGSVTWSE